MLPAKNIATLQILAECWTIKCAKQCSDMSWSQVCHYSRRPPAPVPVRVCACVWLDGIVGVDDRSGVRLHTTLRPSARVWHTQPDIWATYSGYKSKHATMYGVLQAELLVEITKIKKTLELKSQTLAATAMRQSTTCSSVSRLRPSFLVTAGWPPPP